MPSSYTSLAYHIVFSTKYRKPFLTEAVQAETYRYVAGIIANKCSPRMALADFVRDIKANSSKWLHEEKHLARFAWQTGYGAFTVSCSQVETVRDYIRNQREHHHKQSFEDEFRAILARHGISFDEKYLFETEHLG